MHLTHDTRPAPTGWLEFATEHGWRTEPCADGTPAHIACAEGCDDAELLGVPSGSDGA